MGSSTRSSLSAAKETEAQELALRLRELAAEEFLHMARLLFGKPDREIFGHTEFQLRNHVLQMGPRPWQKRKGNKEKKSGQGELFLIGGWHALSLRRACEARSRR